MLASRTIKLFTPGEVVTFDRSRCLRHRFAPSSCRKCSNACPHEAISWGDSGLQRDEKACQSCMLCVAVCPSGAFVPGEVSLITVLQELASEAKPTLACSLKSASQGHARVPCLGLLAHPELLLAMRLALGRALILNLSHCGDCPNANMIKHLQGAVEQQAHLANDTFGRIKMVRDSSQIDFQEKVCSRRELFSLMRRKSKQTAVTMIDRLQEPSPGGVYGKKALPFVRSILLQVLALLPSAQRAELECELFPKLRFLEECTACTGCVGICPTGALKPPSEPGLPPEPANEFCTQCQLCEDFCIHSGIRITSAH